MLTAQRMTFDDLMVIPDDDHLYELVRGEIIRMPPPKGDHGDIEAALVEAIGRHLHERALHHGWQESQGRAERNRLVGRLVSGEAGVRFSIPTDPDQLRGVDAGYLSVEQVARLGASSGGEYIAEVPSLVAEVISPSESSEYIEEKVADYLAGGAQIVWLLFPKTRTVRVCLPDGSTHLVGPDGTLSGENVLPEFSVALANLFP
jgi:Uma2 family endonuclease